MTMLSADTIRRLAHIANKNREAIANDNTRSALAIIKDLICKSEIVWGVWRDDSKACGVGMQLIKGETSLENIVDDEQLNMTAVPCNSAEQAEALRQVAAKNRWRGPLQTQALSRWGASHPGAREIDGAGLSLN